MFCFCRGKAIPKKDGTESSTAPPNPDPQAPETSAEPAKEQEPAHPESDVLMKSTEDVDDGTPADDPPSPCQPASPIKDTTQVVTGDEVVVTSGRKTSSKAKNVLAKVISKDEPSFDDKGKSSLELSNVETMSPEEIQAVYMTRLNTSQDMEASLFNALKNKYEVMLTSFL